jgi:hypothetical protein
VNLENFGVNSIRGKKMANITILKWTGRIKASLNEVTIQISGGLSASYQQQVDIFPVNWPINISGGGLIGSFISSPTSGIFSGAVVLPKANNQVPNPTNVRLTGSYEIINTQTTEINLNTWFGFKDRFRLNPLDNTRYVKTFTKTIDNNTQVIEEFDIIVESTDFVNLPTNTRIQEYLLINPGTKEWNQQVLETGTPYNLQGQLNPGWSLSSQGVPIFTAIGSSIPTVQQTQLPVKKIITTPNPYTRSEENDDSPQEVLNPKDLPGPNATSIPVPTPPPPPAAAKKAPTPVTTQTRNTVSTSRTATSARSVPSAAPAKPAAGNLTRQQYNAAVANLARINQDLAAAQNQLNTLYRNRNPRNAAQIKALGTTVARLKSQAASAKQTVDRLKKSI